MDTWLIFFLVCFAGIAFMFYCLLRRQDAILKAVRDEHAQFRVLLRAMSARLETRTDQAEEYEEYQGEGRESAPLSVDEALDAYARKERLDMDHPRGSGKGSLPDLKF